MKEKKKVDFLAFTELKKKHRSYDSGKERHVESTGDLCSRGNDFDWHKVSMNRVVHVSGRLGM